jgi:hypothetical protein
MLESLPLTTILVHETSPNHKHATKTSKAVHIRVLGLIFQGYEQQLKYIVSNKNKSKKNNLKTNKKPKKIDQHILF